MTQKLIKDHLAYEKRNKDVNEKIQRVKLKKKSCTFSPILQRKNEFNEEVIFLLFFSVKKYQYSCTLSPIIQGK
jgi:hypothetical protein